MYKLFIISIIAILLFLGCEENINFQTEFEEDISLFCIINGDTSYHTVVIMRSFEYKELSQNNFVENAQVSLTSDLDSDHHGSDHQPHRPED